MIFKTGLKTRIRKYLHRYRYPSAEKFKDTAFPLRGQGESSIKQIVKNIEQELKDQNSNSTLGYLHTKPHPLTLKIWKRLLKYNPNNLGTFGDKKIKDLTGTQKTEATLIKKIINLLGGDKTLWSGYVTSGATEANIFASWTGRNLLVNKYGIKKICLISNTLTHYSVSKAADLINLRHFKIGADRKTWNFNTDHLVGNIDSLIKKGYRGFLIPLTLGYTQTGTNDNLELITKRLSEMQNSRNVKIFVWIDAAINGMVLPFLKNGFSPIKLRGISAIAMDFHKTSMCPIPSGIVIYKKSLKKYVGQEVAYLSEPDYTLLGSRSGIPALAMLTLVSKLGFSGYKEGLMAAIKTKHKFIEVIRKSPGFLGMEDIELINEEPGISICIVSKRPLPAEFVQKNGIYAKLWRYSFVNSSEDLYLYKINFLPVPY